MKWMQLKYVFSKTSKKQILRLGYKITQKSGSKDFIKECFRNIFQTHLIQTLR